jgi:hypothetical protein
MGFTLVAAQKPIGPYPAGAPAAASLALAMVAMDASNGNEVALTGHEIVIFQNTDTNPHTITILSVADSRGRSQDITAYSIAGGTLAMFSFLSGTEGWQQGDGDAHFQTSSALIFMAALYVQR